MLQQAQTATADAVVKDRNLQYTFRPQPNGSLFGTGTVDYIAHYAQDKLKKPVKDIRAAVIHEDGPYGAGVAASNESEAIMRCYRDQNLSWQGLRDVVRGQARQRCAQRSIGAAGRGHLGRVRRYRGQGLVCRQLDGR